MVQATIKDLRAAGFIVVDENDAGFIVGGRREEKFTKVTPGT